MSKKPLLERVETFLRNGLPDDEPKTIQYVMLARQLIEELAGELRRLQQPLGQRRLL